MEIVEDPSNKNEHNVSDNYYISLEAPQVQHNHTGSKLVLMVLIPVQQKLKTKNQIQ